MITLTNQQARQFLLLKHGLLGEHRFIGKHGALAYVRQTGCIQFDPVDACGKNPELVLQSRVKGFTKQMLDELLYTDRNLFDFPDKNLSILPIEDWPFFERNRRIAREGGTKFPELAELEKQAKSYIREYGPVSSDELPLTGKIQWHSHIHWSGNWGEESNAARSVLEQLYSTGELVIHHKKGTRKFYDLSETHVDPSILSANDPLSDEFSHIKWRVLRRIGAVGLLWNKPSDAWLNIWGLKATERNEVFKQLLHEGKILSVQVNGLKDTLYCRAEDRPFIESVSIGTLSTEADSIETISNESGPKEKVFRPRCEFIAPLDCFMWDRKLIKTLFNFEYSWEIYTPADKRKYGYYVLPVLYGDRFIGRIEAVVDRKAQTLMVKNFWFESGVRSTKKLRTAIENSIERLANFNSCQTIDYVNVSAILHSAEPE